jgi:nitroimidazol reductase NimA-like FMN-containing flavoprotein (pyridoxamine 5'-phosphate oxidase superfamily)
MHCSGARWVPRPYAVRARTAMPGRLGVTQLAQPTCMCMIARFPPSELSTHRSEEGRKISNSALNEFACFDLYEGERF